MSEHKDNRRSRGTLLAIIACFLAPLLAAIYLNSAWSDWAPQSTMNRGTLLEPPLKLGDAQQAQIQASEPWILLRVVDDCAVIDCAAERLALAQVDRALGRRGEGLGVALLSGPQSSSLDSGAYYVRDPRGQLIMQYDEDTTTSDILHDLERLLKTDRSTP